MDTPIQIRDFNVQILHQDENLKRPDLGQSFLITHRRMWIKRPSKIRYEPSLTMYMSDGSRSIVDDQNFNGVYLALAGKGSFTVENEAGITDNDLANCVIEVSKKMTAYTEENKEQFSMHLSPVQPEFSNVLEEVRAFLNKDSN